MANLRDIKRRIVSIENTQKITSAMKMVAAAKLRRAQQAVEAVRPYAARMRETLQEVAHRETDSQNPLLTPHAEVRRVSLVVVVSDRGLAGAFNNQVLKLAQRLVLQHVAAGREVELNLVGRRACDFFKRRRADQIVLAEVTGPHISYPQAARIAGGLIHAYETGEVDAVQVVFNRFVTAMTQTPNSVSLLPIAAAEDAADEATGRYTIEPDAQKLLAILAPKAVQVELFRALLESQAGEHAARMAAMESATKNTEDLIDRLTLDFNRARQAAITRELVEIVTGAQALE